MSTEMIPTTAQSALDPPADEVSATAPRRSVRRVLWRWGGSFASGTEWLFGLASTVMGLALLATIPLVQLLSLGYLLESSGRIARSGRLRDGLIGIRKAARMGSVALGTWLLLWPPRLVSGMWYSSLIINGHDATTTRWRVALVAVTLVCLGQICWAWLRGGRLRHFFWPAPRRLWRLLRVGGWYATARDNFWQFVRELRLSYYFQLGLRGGLGALIWLILPISLLVLASRLPLPWSVFSGLLGAILLATVLLYLPYLQTRFAARNEWRQWFQVRAVRANFSRAPIAFWISFLATLILAIPLYLLKAELVPREAAWLPSLVFVLFIWPARMLTGWAVGRAERREMPRHFVFRWLARLALLPVAGIYVLVVYFTQFISWYGGWSLYEQHAFLVPVPFLGL